MAKNIKGAAKAIAEKYNTRNPFEIADYLGIYVHRGNLGDILGCYMMNGNGNKIIMLNSLITSRATEFFVMAHELGHAILHEDNECYLYGEGTLFLKSKTEKEAHRFAAELLITDEFIKRYPGMTGEQLSRIAGYHFNIMEYKKI